MLVFLLLNDRENSINGEDGVKHYDLILYGRIGVVQTYKKLEHTVITFGYSFHGTAATRWNGIIDQCFIPKSFEFAIVNTHRMILL
jgi:hypothetical protein